MAAKKEKKEFTGEELNRAIIFTAVKTLAVLLVAVVMIFSLFLVTAPASAGDFFYSMGMNNLSAKMTYNAAVRTDNKADVKDDEKFNCWYATLVRGVAAENYEITYKSTRKLLDNFTEDYDKLIAKKDIKVGETVYYAKKYVSYHEVRSGVLCFKNSELSHFWEKAVKWTVRERYTTRWNLERFNTALNPLKGYLDAITKGTSIAVDENEFLKLMTDLWAAKTGGKDNFFFEMGRINASDTYTEELNKEEKYELGIYILKLIDARTSAGVWTGESRADWAAKVFAVKP